MRIVRDLLLRDVSSSIWRKDSAGEGSDQSTVDKSSQRLSRECHMTGEGPNCSTVTTYHLEGDHLNMEDNERTVHVTSSLEALSLSEENHTHNITCTCECHTHREPSISCDCHMTHLDVYSNSTTPVYYNQHRSCREEAINIYNDITVDELAGYLDELLYLPRPMSDMAELMYT